LLDAGPRPSKATRRGPTAGRRAFAVLLSIAYAGPGVRKESINLQRHKTLHPARHAFSALPIVSRCL